MNVTTIFTFVLFFSLTAHGAPAAPGAPSEVNHPGSKIYSYGFSNKIIVCSGRKIEAFLPVSTSNGETFPVVIYGHGQALDVENYRGTFEHLAKKGVAVIFPAYDTGFFDQDWPRMGKDYNSLSDCAITHFSQIDSTKVIYSGHSKGAYVASIAAGQAFQNATPVQPRSIILFEPAGADESTLAYIGSDISTTIIFADQDTTVEKSFSETIYSSVNSSHKQLITLKSYSNLKADHMWPLTKGTFFGGGAESALHYYGAWKWLIGAAWDLSDGGKMNNPFLYGKEALDKGVTGFNDDAQRNF
jgi:hypothetical protein